MIVKWHSRSSFLSKLTDLLLHHQFCTIYQDFHALIKISRRKELSSIMQPNGVFVLLCQIQVQEEWQLKDKPTTMTLEIQQDTIWMQLFQSGRIGKWLTMSPKNFQKLLMNFSQLIIQERELQATVLEVTEQWLLTLEIQECINQYLLWHQSATHQIANGVKKRLRVSLVALKLELNTTQLSWLLTTMDQRSQFWLTKVQVINSSSTVKWELKSSITLLVLLDIQLSLDGNQDMTTHSIPTLLSWQITLLIMPPSWVLDQRCHNKNKVDSDWCD